MILKELLCKFKYGNGMILTNENTNSLLKDIKVMKNVLCGNMYNAPLNPKELFLKCEEDTGEDLRKFCNMNSKMEHVKNC